MIELKMHQRSNVLYTFSQRTKLRILLGQRSSNETKSWQRITYSRDCTCIHILHIHRVCPYASWHERPQGLTCSRDETVDQFLRNNTRSPGSGSSERFKWNKKKPIRGKHGETEKQAAEFFETAENRSRDFLINHPLKVWDEHIHRVLRFKERDKNWLGDLFLFACRATVERIARECCHNDPPAIERDYDATPRENKAGRLGLFVLVLCLNVCRSVTRNPRDSVRYSARASTYTPGGLKLHDWCRVFWKWEIQFLGN